AAHPPFPRRGPLDLRAERPQCLGGIEDILAFEQAADRRLADRERADDQGPMRDRFIAGYAHTAFQRAMAAGGEGWGIGAHRERIQPASSITGARQSAIDR